MFILLLEDVVAGFQRTRATIRGMEREPRKDDLCLALVELATTIGFEFTNDEKKRRPPVRACSPRFEETRRHPRATPLPLIIDNVDRPGLLDPAQVARSNGGDWLQIPATTWLGENELHGAHKDRSFLAIDELPSDGALAFIESDQSDGRFRSKSERDAAHKIVRLLGSFTLAVESAALYLG